MAALGAAGLGACAVLAACSPVQVGAAAVVGNQRITISSLDTQVSNLQASVTHYGSTLQSINSQLQQQQQQLPVYAAPLSRVVLNWQITFAISDQMAAANGISVSPAQGQAALSKAAKANGVSTNVYLTAIGIPVQQSQQGGRYVAEQTALEAKFGSSNTTALTKAACSAAKGLSINVSPQFGRFDYSALSLVAGNDTLSRPAGTPSPANTEGLTPAC